MKTRKSMKVMVVSVAAVVTALMTAPSFAIGGLNVGGVAGGGNGLLRGGIVGNVTGGGNNNGLLGGGLLRGVTGRNGVVGGVIGGDRGLLRGGIVGGNRGLLGGIGRR